jgi:hypothetical protein
MKLLQDSTEHYLVDTGWWGILPGSIFYRVSTKLKYKSCYFTYLNISVEVCVVTIKMWIDLKNQCILNEAFFRKVVHTSNPNILEAKDPPSLGQPKLQ